MLSWDSHGLTHNKVMNMQSCKTVLGHCNTKAFHVKVHDISRHGNIGSSTEIEFFCYNLAWNEPDTWSWQYFSSVLCITSGMVSVGL
jgi:hypothetical protein